VNSRDDITRGAVYIAFAKKGTPEFPEACQAVVDAWMTWPYLEHVDAVERDVVAIGLEALRESKVARSNSLREAA
jgi:hypothetical protein